MIVFSEEILLNLKHLSMEIKRETEKLNTNGMEEVENFLRNFISRLKRKDRELMIFSKVIKDYSRMILS
jgi:phage host-nuclease inhibitor protein Gam